MLKWQRHGGLALQFGIYTETNDTRWVSNGSLVCSKHENKGRQESGVALICSADFFVSYLPTGSIPQHPSLSFLQMTLLDKVMEGLAFSNSLLSSGSPQQESYSGSPCTSSFQGFIALQILM